MTTDKTSHLDSQYLNYSRLDTPLGPMLAIASESVVHVLEFINHDAYTNQLETFGQKFNLVLKDDNNSLLKQLRTQVDEYFSQKRTIFDLPLNPKGTVFQNQVWSALQSVPFGETRSYQQIATQIGKPKAVRAVANSIGANPIAIVIPCHRIIGKNGSLTGYAGGLQRKEKLLELEG